jgi:metallo-beta-lactamase class B
VWLAPHGGFFSLERKAHRLERGEKPNPFIDPKGFRAFIDRTERGYLNQLKKELAGQSK